MCSRMDQFNKADSWGVSSLAGSVAEQSRLVGRWMQNSWFALRWQSETQTYGGTDSSNKQTHGHLISSFEQRTIRPRAKHYEQQNNNETNEESFLGHSRQALAKRGRESDGRSSPINISSTPAPRILPHNLREELNELSDEQWELLQKACLRPKNVPMLCDLEASINREFDKIVFFRDCSSHTQTKTGDSDGYDAFVRTQLLVRAAIMCLHPTQYAVGGCLSCTSTASAHESEVSAI